jgi:hypothetical protein
LRFLALIGLILVGCQAPDGPAGSAPTRLDESLQPAFSALKAALDEGSDDVARMILARLRPRCQDELSLHIVQGYERILAGRSLRDATKAALLIVEVEDGFDVNLSLQQRVYPLVELAPGYVRVEWTAWSIDTLGRQSAQVDGRILRVPVAWQIPAGETLSVVLGTDSPRIGEGALAVRVEWKISLGAGSAFVGGERFPLQDLQVEDGVVVRLSKDLPTGPVEPAELFRYASSEAVNRPALLERAVRILPLRYEETLDLLAEGEAEFSPAAMRDLVPVMAWLTGSSGISATGEEWRGWLQKRLVVKDQRGNLDLPDDTER